MTTLSNEAALSLIRVKVRICAGSKADHILPVEHDVQSPQTSFSPQQHFSRNQTSSITYTSSLMFHNARRGGSSSLITLLSEPEPQSTTHENPQLQGNEFPCFNNGDVVISLSPAPSDTLILHSDKLSAFSEIFRAGLDEPWSANKIAGVRTVNGQDIVMKRYELDFAPEYESEGVFASLVSDVGKISLYESEDDQEWEHSSDAKGLDSDEESHSPGTSMLVGKVH